VLEGTSPRTPHLAGKDMEESSELISPHKFTAHPSLATVNSSADDDGSMVSHCFEIDCHQRLNKARSLEEFSSIILDLVRSLGGTDFSLTRMASKNPAIAMVLGTTPRAMTDHYKHKNVWMHDLMIQYAADPANTKPMYQSTIDDFIEKATFLSETIRSNRETRQFIQGYGYMDYYDIPISAANGNGNVLMAVTAKKLDLADFQCFVESKKYLLQIIGRAVDYVGTRKFPESFLDAEESRTIKITPKPLRLLTAIAQQNLTLAEIAKKLHITQSAANQQMAAAKAAFGAKTIGHAIYCALKAGLID
jgi:hypothetical protein